MDLLQAILALIGTIAGIAAVVVNRRAAAAEALRTAIQQA